MLLTTDIAYAIIHHIILTFSLSNNACFVSKCTSELRMAIASYIAQDFKNLRVVRVHAKYQLPKNLLC